MTELRVYSPIRLYEKLPYEPPWTDTGEDERELTSDEVQQCCDAVCEVMQRCLTAEEKENGLAVGMDGIERAYPTAEADEEGLTAVLLCACERELMPEELDALSDWWERECRYGFGKRLLRRSIQVRGIGSVAVRMSEYSEGHAFSEEMEVKV